MLGDSDEIDLTDPVDVSGETAVWLDPTPAESAESGESGSPFLTYPRFVEYPRAVEWIPSDDRAAMIDAVLVELNDALIAGDFARCDARLASYGPLPGSVAVSVLGITVKAADRLPSREAFWRRTFDAIAAEKGRRYARELLGKYRGSPAPTSLPPEDLTGSPDVSDLGRWEPSDTEVFGYLLAVALLILVAAGLWSVT